MRRFRSSSKKLAIIGWEEGLAGQIHSFIEQDSDFKVVLFIHPFDGQLEIDEDHALANRVVNSFSIPQKGKFKFVPLFCGLNWPDYCKKNSISHVVVALSDNKLRSENIIKARNNEIVLVTARHCSVNVMPDAVIGQNCILLANSFVGYKAELADGVILNTGSSIDHHCRIDECVNVSPGVVVGGNSSIGKFTKVNMGAVIFNRVRIGESVTIGAGSLVNKDVQSGDQVYGSPARVIGQ